MKEIAFLMGILAKKILNSLEPKQKLDLEAFKSKILSLTSPDKIIVFGSAKNSLLSPLSDIDAALIFSDKKSLQEGKRKIYRAPCFKDIETDFLFYTSDIFEEKAQIGGICFEIFHTGKVIYDKKSTLQKRVC